MKLNEEQREAFEMLANAYKAVSDCWSSEWDGNEELGRFLPHMDVYEASEQLEQMLEECEEEKEAFEFFCKSCKKDKYLQVYPKDILRWQNGELAQEVFTYLTPAERELMISHTCGDCWTKLFSFSTDGEEYA
jgi:hypothetical protein